MTASGYGSGLPSAPNRVGAAAHGTGLPDDAVQFIAYDPAGGDVERAWRIKNLNDYLSAGGGSGPTLVVVDIAFNTANILNGILAVTLPAFGYLPTNATALVIETPFDGTTPQINFGLTQADSTNNGSPFASASQVNLNDTDNGDGTRTPRSRNQIQNKYAAPTDAEIWIGLDDGLGGDPGCTAGLAHWFLTYWPLA